MKATTLVASLALFASTLAAPANQDHHHGVRKHHHKRELQERAYVVVDVTVTVGVDGLPIATQAVTVTEQDSTAAVTAAAGANEKLAVAAVTSTIVAPTTVLTTSQTPAPETVQQSTTETSSTPAPTTQEPESTTSSIHAASTSSSSSSNSNSASSGSSSGLAIQAGSVANPMVQGVAPSVAFQDGTIPCSQFPSSAPGILELDYLGFGGWTGIQINGGAGTSCVEGALCSYSCQPGAEKTQWPSSQPSDGESRGGLTCKNGLLYLSDSSKPYLCQWGELTAFVKSSLSQGVAICQTDYPGSENMVIPTYVSPGSTAPLAVPDEATYYQWEGKPTSAQYYVNNAGVSQQDGCLWGTPGSSVGNYAPLNFGAGWTSGTTWLSLIANPNSNSVLNYNVKFVAGSGTTMNGDCNYSNGVYSGSSATSNGCTVSCNGPCYFELY